MAAAAVRGVAIPQAVRGIAQAFFEGVGNIQDGADPLVEAARQCPEEAVWFIKVVMFFGSVSGVLISIPCGAFLLARWAPCGQCDRPLRCWVLVHCLLQCMLAPVRFTFYLRLRRVQRGNGNLRECLGQLTGSLAWRASKAASVVSYGWSFLGMVWLLNSAHCPTCPGLYRMCVAVLCTAATRLAMSVVFFSRCFPPLPDQPPAPKPRGATQDIIDTMPVVPFRASAPAQEASCAVCLNDFEPDDPVRHLPCKHLFHRACIDKWLKRNKSCPLCLHDIQAPPAASAKKGN